MFTLLVVSCFFFCCAFSHCNVIFLRAMADSLSAVTTLASIQLRLAKALQSRFQVSWRNAAGDRLQVRNDGSVRG